MERPSPIVNRTYQLLTCLLTKASVFTSFFTFSQAKIRHISKGKKLQAGITNREELIASREWLIANSKVQMANSIYNPITLFHYSSRLLQLKYKAVKFLRANATGGFLGRRIEEGVKSPVKLESKNRPASLAKSFCFSLRKREEN